MCEYSNMNQEAALRREARRRKILENSTNRLKLIEGVNSSLERNSVPDLTEIPDTKTYYAKPSEGIHNIELKKIEPEKKYSEVFKEYKELKNISDYLLQGEQREKDEEEEELTEEEEEIREVEPEERKWVFRFLLQKRLHYILLAVLVNVLFFFDAGYLFYENVFCPFYTVKIIELIIKRREQEEIQPMLFLLLASLPRGLQKFTKNYLQLFSGLLSDLLLYIFTFIVGTKLINIQKVHVAIWKR